MTTRLGWVLTLMLAFVATTGCVSRQGRPVAMMPAAPIDNTPRPKIAGPARGKDPSVAMSTALAPLKKASGEEESVYEFPIPKAPTDSVPVVPKTDLAPPPGSLPGTPPGAPPSPIQPIAPPPPMLPPDLPPDLPPSSPPKQTSDNSSTTTPSVSLTGLVPVDDLPSSDKVIVIGAEEPNRVVRGSRPSADAGNTPKGGVSIVGDNNDQTFRKRYPTPEENEKLFPAIQAATQAARENPMPAAIPPTAPPPPGVQVASGNPPDAKKIFGNGVIEVTDTTPAPPPAPIQLPPIPTTPSLPPAIPAAPIRIDEAPPANPGIAQKQDTAAPALTPPPAATPAATPAAPGTASDNLEKLHDLAERAKRTEATMTSYTLRLRRREMVGGKARPEEVLVAKFRKEPFSVYLKWIGEEHKNREVCFVKGQYDDKIHTLLAPGDHFLFSGKPMAFPIDSPLVKSNSRYPITDGGLGPLVVRFGKLVAALEAGDTREGTAKYLGKVKRPEFEEPVEGVELQIPPNALFPKGGRRYLYFNAQAVPVLIVAFDDHNREVEYYCHDRILTPANLDDDDFNPTKLFKR